MQAFAAILVKLWDILYEISKLIFWEKHKKNYKFAERVVKVKASEYLGLTILLEPHGVCVGGGGGDCAHLR